MRARRLILFDIDATLITSGGEGLRAMRDAGRTLFTPAFSIEGIEAAGRLDPAIMGEMLTANGIDPTPTNLAAFREAYARRLDAVLRPGEGSPRPLAGVIDLLEALASESGVVLGLLTGNFPETGEIKLRRAGIDFDHFLLGAWGSDSTSRPPERHDLPPVAMQRYRDRFACSVAPRDVTIVGDTPHDIACARAAGCRSLAVATGRYREADLAPHAPSRLVPSLAATDTLLPWLLADSPPLPADSDALPSDGAHASFPFRRSPRA